MKIFKKNTLKLILFSSLIFSLIACSDISTNNDDDDLFGNEIQITSIDPNSQTIFTKTIGIEKKCVANTDTTHFHMETTNKGILEEKIHYEFLGDTLVLFSYDSTTNTLDSSTGILLTGGTPGTLQGTWNVLLCDYEGDRNDCNDFGSSVGVKLIIQDKITYDFYLLPFDFTRSHIAFGVIRYFVLNDKLPPLGGALSIERRFDLDLPDDVIQIQHLSSTEASFTTPYQTAEYRFDNLSASPNYTSFSMSVTTNGTTCMLNLEATTPDESTCIDSNKSNFLFDVIPADQNSHKTTKLHATTYQNLNYDEFINCLDNVIIRSN